MPRNDPRRLLFVLPCFFGLLGGSFLRRFLGRLFHGFFGGSFFRRLLGGSFLGGSLYCLFRGRFFGGRFLRRRFLGRGFVGCLRDRGFLDGLLGRSLRFQRHRLRLGNRYRLACQRWRHFHLLLVFLLFLFELVEFGVQFRGFFVVVVVEIFHLILGRREFQPIKHSVSLL